MKKIIFLLSITCQLVIAQDNISISNVKEFYGTYVIGDNLYCTYKKDKSKEVSCAKIDLKTFSLEDENFQAKELGEIIELGENKYFRIKTEENLKVFSYINTDNMEEEASLELSIPKNYMTQSITSAYDKENNKMIIIWDLEERFYGFSPKTIIRIITYDFETKEFLNNELDNPTSYISEILTNEVIDNKVIVRLWAEGKYYFAIFDFATNEVKGLKFNGDYKYFNYNAFALNGKTYFVLRSGSSTSKSIYMTHDYVFNVDLESGNTELLGTVGNTKISMSRSGLLNYYEPRYHSNILSYGTNQYVNISYYDEKVRILDFNGDNTTYVEEESIKVPFYREPDFYYNQGNSISCVIDGSKNVKSEIATHTYSLTNNDFLEKSVQKESSTMDGKLFYYRSFESFKSFKGEDIMIKTNIDKKTKTFTITRK